MWIKTKPLGSDEPYLLNSKYIIDITYNYEWVDVMVADSGTRVSNGRVYNSDTFSDVTDRESRVAKRLAQCKKAFDYIQYCLERERTIATAAPVICDLNGDLTIPAPETFSDED